MTLSVVYGLIFVVLLSGGAVLWGFRLAHWDLGRLREEWEKLRQNPPW
jgi:hypothetical protein